MTGRGTDALGGLLQGVTNTRIKKLEEQVEGLKGTLERVATAKRDEVLLTSKEIAPYLGVSHWKTVERWTRVKGLPCVHVGRNLRFRLGDVRRWVAQRKEG